MQNSSLAKDLYSVDSNLESGCHDSDLYSDCHEAYLHSDSMPLYSNLQLESKEIWSEFYRVYQLYADLFTVF